MARLRRNQSRRGSPSTSSAIVRRGLPDFLQYDLIPAELAESLRTMITRYELRTGTTMPRSIAFTSALHGEGTTTASQALSTLLAQELGHFVCWVDCRWLVASDPHDRDDGTTFIDMLADPSRVLSAFQSSPELPQLTCLRPGPVPPAKRHMIVRSPEFERLLNILVEEFDHVIFDAPPLLGAGDGLSLLRRCDGYFLVVRSRSTTESEVRRAVELAAPTPNLGAILTDHRSRIPAPILKQLGA